MRIGVIGYGYWGPNLVRNFAELPEYQVVAVSDLSDDRLAPGQGPLSGDRDDHRLSWRSCPDRISTRLPSPLRSSTHYDLASRALAAGKHVFLDQAADADGGTGRAPGRRSGAV